MTNDSTALSPLRHVLVATDETQGTRKNDFCFATVGELVRFGSECDREDIDGGCGCRRALAGLVSLKGTTTFTVVARPMTAADLADALDESYRASGVGAFLKRRDALAEARHLLDLAAGFPVGTVLERRGDTIQVR